MVYQVSSNIAALNAYNNLSVHQAKSSAALARISSGLKAASGGDTASLGIAATINSSMQANLSGVNQVQSAITQLQATDAVLGELISLAQKGIEIATRATDSGADISALAAAMQANQLGITNITADTQFKGAALTGQALNVDIGGTALDLKTTLATAPAFVIADVTAPIEATAAELTTTVGTYNTYINASIDLRAKVSANIAFMQNSLQVLNSVATNEAAGISQAQDTDIAKEMMNLTSANIMTEAATAMLAQAMQMPNSVLKLLQ